MSFQELSNSLLALSKEIDNGKSAKKFLQKAGNKLKKKTVNQAKNSIKNYTGNYIKSIKKGKVYDFKGNLSVRTYSAAPHAHLIEFGHIIKTRNGKEKGFKPGYHVFEKAAKEFEDEFVEDTELFIDDLLNENDLQE